MLASCIEYFENLIAIDQPAQLKPESVLSVNVCSWQIVLQKPQNALRLIFRQRTKQGTIADRCVLKRVTEIASEFSAN